MNVNVKFTGVADEIMADAIKKGLAKTKTEVLRLGLFELKHKYNLLNEDDLTDEDKKHLIAFLKELKESDYATEEEAKNAFK